MQYEELIDKPHPASQDVAFLYHDDGNPVRDHFICYNVSGFERPYHFVVFHMASEDTDFYDYNGAPPQDRGLGIFSVYRVHGSDRVNGYDQHHIVICFADKSIEVTGLTFGFSEPVVGDNALAVLIENVRKRSSLLQ